MRKNKKFLVVISLAALTILIIPLVAAVAAQVSDREPFGIRVSPPKWNGEPGKIIPDSYLANGEKFFGDYEKNFCLGYLVNFKTETLTGDEDTDEAERITRKNNLLEEYRAYVDGLFMQVMTYEEYDAHYDYLMGIFLELLTLEPEQTPEEQLEIDIVRLLSKLKEELYYSELHGEWYIEDRNLNLVELNKSIADLTALQENLSEKKLTFEQAKLEYEACIKKVKIAAPGAVPSTESSALTAKE